VVAARFKVPEETVRASLPYRAYAVYLAKKHTSLSNPEIGAYFGNITFSAVTKTASRLSVRMKKDRTMRKEVDVMEKKLSSVKG
jgi:chromosomal replication initiation ATPase DnaA